MSVFINPKNRILTKDDTSPDPAWEEVKCKGTLMRTAIDKGWVGRHFTQYEKVRAFFTGWEEVSWEEIPIPDHWFEGELSGLRFGFADLSEKEKAEAGQGSAIAVVLPDVPGTISPYNCPGSRYPFMIDMLTGGIYPDYLFEKLLTFYTRRAGMGRVTKIVDGEGLPPEKKRVFEEALDLAHSLSLDLAEKASEIFGVEWEFKNWSRRQMGELEAG